MDETGKMPMHNPPPQPRTTLSALIILFYQQKAISLNQYEILPRLSHITLLGEEEGALDNYQQGHP